jgi:opacity protein-like surface antigen
MRKLMMLSLGLVFCAHTAFAQTATDTTKTKAAADSVAKAAPAAPAVAAPATAAPATVAPATTAPKTAAPAAAAPATTAPKTTAPPPSTSYQGEKVKKGSIYLGGGVAMPMSPDEFKDNYGMGYGGGAGLGYKVTPSVEIIVSGFYNLFSSDFPDSFGVTGGDVSIIEAVGNLKYIFGKGASKIKPYIIGGAGMASVKFSQVDDTSGTVFSADTSETDFIYNLGAGAEITVSPSAAIFIEGFYSSVATEGETSAYVPIRAGLKLTVF